MYSYLYISMFGHSESFDTGNTYNVVTDLFQPTAETITHVVKKKHFPKFEEYLEEMLTQSW